jgi:hypothetical protein
MVSLSRRGRGDNVLASESESNSADVGDGERGESRDSEALILSSSDLYVSLNLSTVHNLSWNQLREGVYVINQGMWDWFRFLQLDFVQASAVVLRRNWGLELHE